MPIEPEEPPSLGQLLRTYRVAGALSQAELAERVAGGLSVKTVGNIERGRHRPQRQVVTALIDALTLTEGERRAFIAAWRRSATPALRRPERPLPQPPTPLIGRTEQVAVVRRLLHVPGARLVTLTGPAGVGKTRMALQVAAEEAAQFPDGVVFVTLDLLDDPGLVPVAIGEAFGVRESVTHNAQEVLQAFLAKKQVLLVLDNLEQVMAAAPLVADLLAACAGLVVLATSRSALRLRGEQEFAVPPLTVPLLTLRCDAEGVGDSPAVRLLVQCAQQATPSFALTSDNAPIVAEICVRLDGLPLAIELAAPWLKLWPVQLLLQQLEHRLEVLVDGPRDLPERQQTLRSALAWSHDLLEPREQVLFRRLAVFAGGWTATSAAAVCADGPPDMQLWTDLARLLDQHMVILRNQNEEEPRFGMLETLGEFALERLEAGGEVALLRQRHAEYFVALAEEAEQSLGTTRPGARTALLDRERANFHAVIVWTREHDGVLALRLGATLWQNWYAKGYLRHGREWFATLLALAENAARTRLRARALLGLGTLSWALGEYPAARTALDEGEAIARELEDWGLVSAALNARGVLAHAEGSFDDAADLYRQSLALARETDNQYAVAIALSNLGVVTTDHGDPTAAIVLFNQALVTFRRLHDQPRIKECEEGIARAREQLAGEAVLV